ncbi:MAG: dual specificity protein phosphatase family protein, partial [Fuerstiella sp.]|nr:dual specificity protein phosphatase family protein [Fuerstiella sp.]
AELRELGVRTVISVDGLKPDVDRARASGLRYIHLPHGYDGIPRQRALELAKAVRNFPGPIYIHCHHGSHRSPAASVVACITAGLIPADTGLQILRAAGTSPDYDGLYRSVQVARPINRSELDTLQVEFREAIDLPLMVEVMTQISQTLEHVEQIAQAGWQLPADDRDASAVQEVLLLQEHFAEFQRDPSVRDRSLEFR